ncbi:hypothetical protein QYM36_003322, partial [Artemia franciscana]
DIRAQANTFPAKYFDTIRLPQDIKQTAQKQIYYYGSRIPGRGTCQVTASYQSQVALKLQFRVVKTDSVSILGLRSSINLNLVKLITN